MSCSLISCFINVDDPQEIAKIENAYAVLMEAHLNFEMQAVIGVFKIWRSEEAYLAQKQAMAELKVPFTPDEGGKEFFECHGMDGANGVMAKNLLKWCVLKSPIMREVDARLTAEDEKCNE
jgi:hypothetical protein